MLTSSLLVKKRDGRRLEDDEIRFLIRGFCSGEVADYQMSALAMAICLQGMDPREIATLTRTMLESGDTLRRVDQADRIRVDKHSTGGLGDKVSLILAPVLAALGLHVPMISGRGLGITGGTLDKLESIEGFQTQLSPDDADRVLREVGAFIVGASQRIAPADRKLYALRDVTGTVESVALITASILSKKLAANLDALVMDVKVGSGAFMKTASQAAELAESLITVGCRAGLPTTAIASDMDQPLGDTIGNAIEINEVVDILQCKANLSGGGNAVRELTIELCAALLMQTGIVAAIDSARKRISDVLDRGDALEHFHRMVRAQGGRLDHPLDLAPQHVIEASQDGFVSGFDCEMIGQSVVAMGGGRRKAGDSIDHRVGVRVHGRIGDRVARGQPILTLHCHKRDVGDYLIALESAVKIADREVASRPLVIRRFSK